MRVGDFVKCAGTDYGLMDSRNVEIHEILRKEGGVHKITAIDHNGVYALLTLQNRPYPLNARFWFGPAFVVVRRKDDFTLGEIDR